MVQKCKMHLNKNDEWCAKFKLRYGDLTSDSDNAHKLEANNIAGDFLT